MWVSLVARVRIMRMVWRCVTSASAALPLCVGHRLSPLARGKLQKKDKYSLFYQWKRTQSGERGGVGIHP